MSLNPIDSQAALRRTAILLSTLGDTAARQMLGNLAPLKRALLRRAMAELTDVDPMERRQAMQQFLQSASSNTSKNLTAATTGTGVPAAVSDSNTPEASSTPLSFLGTVPDGVLLTAIQDEHPQTIAIVLASLQPQQAARLLPRLNESTRNAAVQRLARLEQLPSDALDSIGEHLKKIVADATPSNAAATGNRTLNAILEQVPGELRQNMTDLLGWPAVTESREPLVSGNATLRVAPETLAVNPDDEFDDDENDLVDNPAILDQQLECLRPTELRDGLARLDGQQALLAMCGLPARLADRVLRTLPRRQARKIRQQLQGLDSVTIKQIDLAKQELAVLVGITSPADPTPVPAERPPSRLLSAAA